MPGKNLFPVFGNVLEEIKRVVHCFFIQVTMRKHQWCTIQLVGGWPANSDGTVRLLAALRKGARRRGLPGLQNSHFEYWG